MQVGRWIFNFSTRFLKTLYLLFSPTFTAWSFKEKGNDFSVKFCSHNKNVGKADFFSYLGVAFAKIVLDWTLCLEKNNDGDKNKLGSMTTWPHLACVVIRRGYCILQMVIK